MGEALNCAYTVLTQTEKGKSMKGSQSVSPLHFGRGTQEVSLYPPTTAFGGSLLLDQRKKSYHTVIAVISCPKHHWVHSTLLRCATICRWWGEADRLHGDCIQFLDAIGSALTFENGQLGCTCTTRRALSGKGYMLMIISADQAH